MPQLSQLPSQRLPVSPHGAQFSDEQGSDEHDAAPCHDDEEVEHTRPAQLALNQGHQVLSPRSSDTSRSVHYTGDGRQSLPAAPQGLLPPQVGGYG